MRKAAPEDVPPVYLEALKVVHARIDPQEDVDVEGEQQGGMPCAQARRQAGTGLQLRHPAWPVQSLLLL